LACPPPCRPGFQGNRRRVHQTRSPNEPILILAAPHHGSTSCSACLYEKLQSIPSRFLSTLPVGRRRRDPRVDCCANTEFSVIALIGLILLIGHRPEETRIMMIDFALEAERKEGKTPLDAIYDACRLRFRPIPDDHAGRHDGRHSAGPGPRHRLGGCGCPLGIADRWAGLMVQPGADAVHDAGCLTWDSTG